MVVDLYLEMVVCFVEISNIVVLKDVIGDLSWVVLYWEFCGNDFVLLSGDDVIGLEFVKFGG